MIIIEKPYVSELLIDTIVQNDWFVLNNEAVRLSNIEEGALRLVSDEQAVNYYEKIDYPLIYSNSENSIDWILENLPTSNISRYIKLFKDKGLFRDMLKSLYPNFFYKLVPYENLKNIRLEDLKFPSVLKPAVGFLSLGVHKIYTDSDWKEALFALEKEIKETTKLYPQRVVNTANFLIEEFIEGEEFAIDAYYDIDGTPVILNIFEHPFLDSKDVKDRIYLTSKNTMMKYMSDFSTLLKKIGECNDIRNFPIHIEVKISPNGNVIPIEVNPMRFAGWCTTDVAKYAWGINTYEYFFNQRKPNWNEIFANRGSYEFYFSMAEVPIGLDKNKIKSFNYEKFLANYSRVLELRRINYHQHPLFAIIFGAISDPGEIQRILELKTKDYIEFS